MYNESVTLKELIEYLRKIAEQLLVRWRIVLFAALVGGLFGALYAYFKKPTYTAECSFVLEEGDKGSSFGSYAGLASLVGIDIGGGGGLFQGDNIIQLYQSRSMLVKTLLTRSNFNADSQLLVERFIENKELREKWRKNSELANIDFDKRHSEFSVRHDSVLTEICKMILKNNLMVFKPDKKLSIINVTFKDTDELFAKQFTESLVENVNQFYIETKTKKSLQNIQILQHQTDSVRSALNSAISGVALSVDLNPNANPARQILRVPSQKRSVDVQANTAILSELVKNLEISKVSLRRETPLIQIIDGPVLPLKKDKPSKIVYSILASFAFTILSAISILFVQGIKKK